MSFCRAKFDSAPFVPHQFRVYPRHDRGAQLILKGQRIGHLPVEPAGPDDFAAGAHIHQPDDDPDPSRPVLDRAVQQQVCFRDFPGIRQTARACLRPPSRQVIAGTQEIQRNRDRPAEISSASPIASPSSRSSPSVRSGATRTRSEDRPPR